MYDFVSVELLWWLPSPPAFLDRETASLNVLKRLDPDGAPGMPPGTDPRTDASPSHHSAASDRGALRSGSSFCRRFSFRSRTSSLLSASSPGVWSCIRAQAK